MKRSISARCTPTRRRAPRSQSVRGGRARRPVALERGPRSHRHQRRGASCTQPVRYGSLRGRARMVRGIRALISKTAPGKLTGSGKFRCYRATSTTTGRPEGAKLRGITKLLTARVYSAAPLPSVSTWRGGAWAGAEGGLRRGRAVDSQVSRLVNVGVLARRAARMLKLTRLAFDALAQHNLVPVGSQRVVIDKARRLGTAVDVVCTRGAHEKETRVC